jgi:hypothetical protein
MAPLTRKKILPQLSRQVPRVMKTIELKSSGDQNAAFLGRATGRAGPGMSVWCLLSGTSIAHDHHGAKHSTETVEHYHTGKDKDKGQGASSSSIPILVLLKKKNIPEPWHTKEKEGR